jgi:integrase/recombinase XerD
MAFISGLRQAGTNPTGCNIHIRCLNAFFRWAGQPPLRKLKEEEKIPPTFSPSEIQKLLKHKPRSNHCRIYLLMLTLLDAGLRINEALSLQKADVDLDNLLFLVKGKGNKERMVPFSLELRKHLWRHLSTHPHSLILCTRDGKKLMTETFFAM